MKAKKSPRLSAVTERYWARDAVKWESARKDCEDTGRYASGYRVYRDGSYREDFGSDR